jgi:LAO/AO transport system kinase
VQLAQRLRERDVSAAPAVLNLLESDTPTDLREGAALLAALSPAALGHEPPAHVIGVTGPPGAGKSTLLSALIGEWRSRGRSVAVLAIDPSSKRSGGSLLGDRARIAFDPSDHAVFIRSTAAGERLGGIARATRAAAHALSAAFDIVIVETVGVGQAETDIAELADTVVVVVQPGSGDALQFIKSGIMEIPDVLVVTKSDLGAVALSALRDLRAALRSLGKRDVGALAVSAVSPAKGIPELVEAIEAHRAALDLPARRVSSRRAGALIDFVTEWGERGLRAIGGRREANRWLAAQDPGLDVATLTQMLSERVA